MQLISRDPKAHTGLPKQFVWLISVIMSQSKIKITETEIFVTLYKLKLNLPVNIICKHFQISRETFSRYFRVGTRVLASYFQNFIFLPPLLKIEQNLPLPFKQRFSNVCLLLGTFEIEIQKPKISEYRAQTRSEHKNTNTIKYLLGSTPDGYISYISKGFGGRISDKNLVEKSDFLDWVPSGTVIMTDRAFKDIKALLMGKGVKVLLSQSVHTSSKPATKKSVQIKTFKNLSVHLERVLKSVREFKFLNSVVSHKHIGYLNDIVLISCGLVNLQNETLNSE